MSERAEEPVEDIGRAEKVAPVEALRPDEATGSCPELCSDLWVPEPAGTTAQESRWELVPKLESIIREGFRDLQQAFEDKLAYDESKDRQLTRLHEELQQHRQDLLAKVKRPLLQGLLRLHDDIGKVVKALAAGPEAESRPERFLAAFDGFRDDLELILAQHGVEPFEMPGSDFDPQRQTALRTEVTADPGEVGRLAYRLRPGFAEGEVVLQKERVAVYVATPHRG